MKSTPVKDTGAALLNLTASQANRKADMGDFQKIWSNQMEKGTQGSQTAGEKEYKPAEQKSDGIKGEDSLWGKQGSSLKIRKESQVQKGEENALEEVSSQEAERVMELLGTAGLELMRQIADIFGVTMEELEAVMGELNLEPADLLDAAVLGNFLLELGGAEDVYALVTDEALYEDYQAVMEQLQNVLEESAGQLNKEPEELVSLVKDRNIIEMSENTEVRLTAEETGNVPAAERPKVQDTAETYDTEESQEPLQSVQTLRDRADASEGKGSKAGENGRQSDRRTDQGEHVNMTIQNIRSEQFKPDAVQTESVTQSSAWTAETRNIMDQIMDYMKLHLSPDATSLEMQLHPASLGTLQVQIASKGGIVTANFITQNEAVKAALESQMIQLRESFEEQGVKIEAIEVTVQTHEFERNLEQGRGRNQQTPERKNRTRRIRLGEDLTMENMEQEDVLTAEMMVMGGSTVNYTA